MHRSFLTELYLLVRFCWLIRRTTCPVAMRLHMPHRCMHSASARFCNRSIWRKCPSIQSQLPSKTARTVHSSAAAKDVETEEKEEHLSDEYNEEMQKKMGTSMTYDHSLGMNYDRILPDLIVGSCPQVPEDINRLVFEEKVGPVICLQRDTDMEFFDLDIAPIQQRCAELKSIHHVRLPINDFDPFNLRQRLPDVIRGMVAAHDEAGGSAYVHCTAGMGRAPAVALAYMWWVKGMHLEDAHAMLQAARPCHPKLYAIRQATADILFGGEPQDVVIRKRGTSGSAVVEIAGLDAGWGNRLPMERVGPDTWELRRTLPPGSFPYKFVMDGVWSYDADMYTAFDGDNTNNIEEVIPAGLTDKERQALHRVLNDNGRLSKEELAKIRAFLGVAA